MTLTEAIDVIKKAIGRRAFDKRTIEYRAVNRVELEYEDPLEEEKVLANIDRIINEVMEGNNEK